MSKLKSPNYTQTPNDLFELMSEMSNPCLRVMLALTRQTFGYHRKKVCFSVGKIEEMTGMTRNSVKKGADEAEALGLIRRVNPDSIKSAEWEIVVDETPSRIYPVTLTDLPSDPQSMRDSHGLKESIKESNKETSANAENDSDFWEKKRQEKKETPKALQDDREFILPTDWIIGSGSRQKITQGNQDAMKSDSAQDRLSGWHDVAGITNEHIMVADTFWQLSKIKPPKAPRGKSKAGEAAHFYAWKAGIEKLLPLGTVGDVIQAMKSAWLEYSDDFTPKSPDGMAKAVYEELNKEKPKEEKTEYYQAPERKRTPRPKE